MALLNTDNLKREEIGTPIVLPMLKLSEAQKKDANGNSIIGELRNKKMSLKDTMSEYGTDSNMFIAYTTFMEFKKTIKMSNLSNMRKVSLMTKMVSEIDDTEIKRLVAIFNNKVMIKNIIDNMYDVNTIDVELLEEGQVLYSYIRNTYFGDGSLYEENTLCQAQTKNDKLKSSDILKGSTPKFEMEFIQLAQKCQETKVKYTSFKEYMIDFEIEIIEFHKELYSTKTKIINNYRTR